MKKITYCSAWNRNGSINDDGELTTATFIPMELLLHYCL